MWGYEVLLFEGLESELIDPGIQYKGSHLRGAWIIYEEDSCANLEVSARRMRTS